MKTILLVTLCLLMTACGGREEIVRPGRGVSAEERGPVVRVYPAGREAVEARHGLWRGFDADGQRRWEVRYTRGNPSGAYREWDADGDLLAEWSYSWEGELTGWLRWTDGFKFELAGELPDFDAIGRSETLRAWAEAWGVTSDE
ncbi:MAG: hypothetical protein JJU05_06825 [Verrucomicrobia bacterium]|nr:hypothetical protein [Verrucomicrobiota bacterium]MCH8527039.1 hypothetical protein [Kiritimatiellia bacterium]